MRRVPCGRPSGGRRRARCGTPQGAGPRSGPRRPRPLAHAVQEEPLTRPPEGIADVLGAPGEIKLLLVGINPGLTSSATGHHFARPGNRFWPALHAAGITPRLLAPHEQAELVAYGVGVTNLVARPSAAAAEVTPEELREGAVRLESLARSLQPVVVAILGLTAYRTAFGRPKAAAGPQPERLADSELWVLPNPSGLNASTKPAGHAAGLRAAATAAGLPDTGQSGSSTAANTV